MAYMLPKAVTEFTTETEKLLYRLFQEQLSDRYTVLYNRRWHDATNPGNPDPECDFIILHPDQVILLLEVKGGRWSRADGQWMCYEKSVDKNPEVQALANKRALIHLLSSKAPWSGQYFPISFALAFPESEYPGDEDVYGLPPLMTYEDIDNIEEWVRHVMSGCLAEHRYRFSDFEMCEYVAQCLMRDYTIPLREILRADENRLLVFTNEQLELDKKLKNLKNLTIQGCAGSGKTLMAIRQVQRLDDNSNVNTILFTCFNRELGGWLAKNTKGLKKVTTFPFIDFCEHMSEHAGIDFDKTLPGEEYYNSLPSVFMEANDKLGLKYDAIVVDEGQSMKPDCWEVLKSLLSEPENSYFYVFYDDLQRIYQEKEKYNHVPGEDHPIELTYNVRNTAKIHKASTIFLPKDKLPQCNNISGEPVWLNYYSDRHALRGSIRKILHKLVKEGGLSYKDIVILTPKKSESIFFNDADKNGQMKIGPYFFSDKENDDPSVIRYSTIQAFRGMERQVVIMAELDGKVENLQELFYLGCSRAKTKLVLLVGDDVDEKLKKDIESCCELIQL